MNGDIRDRCFLLSAMHQEISQGLPYLSVIRFRLDRPPYRALLHTQKQYSAPNRNCRIAERTQIRAPGLNGQPGEPGKTPKTPQVQQKSVEANPKKKKKIAAQ